MLNFSATAPTDRLFQQFWDHFAAIDKQNLRLCDWPDTSRPHTLMVARVLEVGELLQEQLLTECFGRDDYRELCQLKIKFAGGQACNIMYTTKFMKNFITSL